MIKKVELPFDRVVVSPFVFRIVHDPARLSQAGGAAMLDRDAAIIYVDVTRNEGVLRDDILHELMHAGYGQTPLYRNGEKESEQEENIVAGLTPRVLALIRDNPQLVGWLTS